tara:strand:+ start:256 stop:597 length:342 start_codon:yes stop_codon:yes gene_type:complete
MSVENRVFKALFKESKIELSAKKIELSLIKDADKLMILGKSFFKGATQTQSNAQGEWKLSSFNYEKAISSYEKALQMAKELGADEIVSNINKQISIAKKQANEAKSYEKKLNL